MSGACQLWQPGPGSAADWGTAQRQAAEPKWLSRLLYMSLSSSVVVLVVVIVGGPGVAQPEPRSESWQLLALPAAAHSTAAD